MATATKTKRSVPVKELKDALSRVLKATKHKSSIQVLYGVKITPKTIEATNMEAYAVVEIDTGLDCDVIADSRTLAKLLSSLKAKDSVVMSIGCDGELLVTSRIGNTGINAFELDDWPTLDLPKRNAKTMTNVFGNAMSMIKDVSKFASTDLSRPVLTGINLRSEGGTLRATATDSYRMACDFVELAKCIDFSVTLPAVSVATMTELSCIYYDKSCQFTTLVGEGFTLHLRNIEGTYPEYDRLRPPVTETLEILDGTVSDMLESLKLMNKLNMRNSPVRMSVNHFANNSGLTLSVVVNDGPSHVSEHMVSRTHGEEEVTTGVNCEFAIDCLEFMGGGCELGYHAVTNHPLLFSSIDSPRRQAILMPVRLPA
jgi:DNA polymerase-3 subunit beta